MAKLHAETQEKMENMNMCFYKCHRNQTMSTVILNFLENLELTNNRTYVKYFVLIKNNLNDF